MKIHQSVHLRPLHLSIHDTHTNQSKVQPQVARKQHIQEHGSIRGWLICAVSSRYLRIQLFPFGELMNKLIQGGTSWFQCQTAIAMTAYRPSQFRLLSHNTRHWAAERTDSYFLTVPEASPRSGCKQGWVP